MNEENSGGLTRTLEDSLNLPLEDVLLRMQRQMMNRSTYFGIEAWKSPIDFWIYQEILFESQPDVIIEIGCNRGGGTLALAHMCKNLGRGRVIGIDISLAKIAPSVAACENIEFIEAEAMSCFETVQSSIKPEERVLVIEDSEHTYENTLALLRLYSELVKVGDYFIVEDSIRNRGITFPEAPDVGPYDAIETFVIENKNFVIDRDKERFLITWNPKGYLQRVS